MIRSNEEELEMRRTKARLGEMSELDKIVCQADTAKHIVMPMNDVINLRRVSQLLHGFATELDLLTRRQDYTARTIILETRALIDGLNREIRDTIGKGKRRKPLEDRSN